MVALGLARTLDEDEGLLYCHETLDEPKCEAERAIKLAWLPKEEWITDVATMCKAMVEGL